MRPPSLSRKAAITGLLAGLNGWPSASNAWCGGDYPGQLIYDEDLLPVKLDTGGTSDVLVRRVGGRIGRGTILQNNVNNAIKRYDLDITQLAPILVVGVPGLQFDYLENLETLAVSGRQVIFVGTCEAVAATEPDKRRWLADEQSTAPTKAPISTEVAASQLLAVCDARGLSKMHVLAHGLGAPAALRLVSELSKRSLANQTAPEIASLVLSSPFGAMDDLSEGGQRRIRDFSELVPLEEATPTEGYSCVVEANTLTGMPWRTMLLEEDGPSASKQERLGGERLATRLPPTTPTLILHGGNTDPVVPGWRNLPKSTRLISFDKSGHLPFIDEREFFLMDVLEFYDGIDGVKTPRVGVVNFNTRYT